MTVCIQRFSIPRSLPSRIGLALVLAMLMPLAPMAHAGSNLGGQGHNACLTAADSAARSTGVPLNVLLAIARTESGRSVDGTKQPWPWTINTAGTGAWLGSRAELLDKALKNLAAGETSFDLGCFQVNYRWHGQNFDSIDQMIDPSSNAQYAAEFLKDLYAEFGNWTSAAGAYHSRTEVHATRYREKFLANLSTETAGMYQPGKGVPSGKSAQKPRENLFPLLQAGQSGTAMGSLVPHNSGARPASLGQILQ